MNEDTIWKMVAISAMIAAVYFANRPCPVCENVTSTFIPDMSPYEGVTINGSAN